MSIMNDAEFVILVDEHNNEIGLMEKYEAHRKAVLHRAFSIFIFNNNNELLIQQRAAAKYHSAGLWTNTCCSHPRAGEDTMDAAHRRLIEEMGFDTPLREKFRFIYKAAFDNGLTEHELDFIYAGTWNEDPKINTSEVQAFRWVSLPVIADEIKANPGHYTAWFKIILQEYLQHL